MARAADSMKELALRTGLSLSSISRALDPARAHLVKPSTREKIRREAERMNFTVNLAARRLKLNRTETITAAVLRDDLVGKLFAPELNSRTMMSYDIQLLAGIMKNAGYDLKIEFFNETMPLDANVFDRNRTDGIIFCSYWGREYGELLRRSGLPSVFMSRYIELDRTDVSFVGLDRTPGFRQAVGSLTAAGKSRIGWLGVPGVRSRAILEMLLRERSLYFPENFFEMRSYFDLRDTVDSLTGLDAVFCSNDVIADWMFRELEYRKIARRPIIIGYDNDPGFPAENGFRRFATIGHEGNPMPALAAEILLKQIRSGSAGGGETLRRIVPAKFFPCKGMDGAQQEP